MLKVFILIFWLILTFSSCSKHLFKTSDEKKAFLSDTTVITPELLSVDDSTLSIADTSITIPDSLKAGTDSLSMLTDSIGEDSVEVTVLEVSENAIEEPIDYKSLDSLLFDVKNQKVYLYGEGQINYGEIELKANYIEVDLDSNLVFAKGVPDSTGKLSGKPNFKDGGDEYDAEEIQYNTKTKKGLIKNVITQQSGGYLHSKRTKMHRDKTIHLKGGKYTTCDLEHPHFYIHLTKAKVIPNDKIVSGPAYLVIEDVPTPLGIPFGFFPNNDKKKSGILIPEYGKEQNRGYFLRNGGYYFSFSNYMDLQLRGDIYANGSWGLMADSRYKVRYKFNGSISAKYASMILDDSGEQRSYWFKWNHQQDSKARPNSRFSANVDFGSSNYNYYNAQSINTRLESETSSSISYNKSFVNSPIPFSISANFRHTQNNLDSTVSLSLPDIALTVPRQTPFKRQNKVGKTKWYEKIGVSMTSNFKNTIRTHEDTLFRQEALEKFTNGVMHKVPVSTSLKLLKFININPSFSYTERWYWKSVEKTWEGLDTAGVDIINTQINPGFKRAGDWLLSVPFSTKLYGIYMNKNTESYFQAVRHVMTPTVSYSYRPEYSLEKYGYYKNVTNSSDSVLQTYSVFNGGSEWSGIYGSPPSGKYGSVNFNLGNNLEMKVKSKRDTTAKKRPPMKLLDNLSIGTSYNMAADSLKWSNINVQARTTVKMFNINATLVYDPYYWNASGYSVDQFIATKKSNELEGVNGVLFDFARLRSANISVGFSFNSSSWDKNKDDETEAKIEAARLAGLPGNYWEHYVDFSIPWNLRINYNYNYSQYLYHVESRNFEYKTTQTVNFNGDFNLTQKWKITFSSGWDFEMKALTSNTNISIYRDLHCWEASFQWIPMGTFRSYSFSINVKASVLKDLKLSRRRSWTDNF